MKVGLLTVHHALNYGAMLQAYATFRILQNLGHEVEFIDYDMRTVSRERRVFLPWWSLGNILRNVRNLFQYKAKRRRIEKFEQFYRQLKTGAHRYKDSRNWDTSGYDVVVTGSDQTFSLYLTNNPQEMRPFFLGHIEGVKKISYASSMGEKFSRLTPEDISWMKKRLAAFDTLTVRESRAADFIEKLIGRRPAVVLDPTLMLSEQEWEGKCIPLSPEKEDYIVFYTVLSDSWVIDAMNALSAETGLKVIALHPRTRFELSTNYQYRIDTSPEEFISLIRNAKYVVTTSFHATCFSILFRKRFVSLVVGEGNRLKTLLSSLGLQKQLIESQDTDVTVRLKQALDYSEVTTLLQKEVNTSLAYLKEALKS